MAGPNPPGTLREQLKESLDEAPWEWLVAHLKRDAVILVAQELDLLEAAEKIARDDKACVAEWIEKGLLAKPTISQIAEWTQFPRKRFLTVIVQPYVLAQEQLLQ